ncbi:MAG TPA: right-handed parallel beta-helix repeat-containing protein [Phycisphaerae bacterium]|jgi:parallel beta-helix repeat protein
MTRKNRIVTLALGAGIAATGLIALAGDLNPPAGPVAPTHKTLTEVEPRIAINAINTPGDADSLFKITLPGSYYLTGNITGVVGKHGIEIVASGVTLDLNGFDLAGVAAMGAFDGVSVTLGGLVNIAVVNGSLRSWGDEDIDLQTLGATNCRLADLFVRGNTGNGILAGPGSTVSNCSAYQKGGIGISAADGCTVSHCTVTSNTGDGIRTANGCTVSNCSAEGNTGVGIGTADGCTVSNCSADGNTGVGIGLASGCTISNCTATGNGGDGINTGNGCTVAECSTRLNAGDGIDVTFGCTVAGCSTRANTLDGIQCSSQCTIRGNTCSLNGNSGDGAGVHATSTDNSIEGNNCTGADRGIDVDFAGNIIIRNTCAGNTTDWVIVANNVFGPIIDRRAPASAAVSGFSAVSSLGSTDANANFSY